MLKRAQVLSLLALPVLAGVLADMSYAEDRRNGFERQMAVAAARQAREAERAGVARQRRERERRRSAAHARMPDAMYASTPSAPAVELGCPVATDDDVRRAVRGWTGDAVSSSSFFSDFSEEFSEDPLAARDGGRFRAPPLQGLLASSSARDGSAEPAPHDARSGAFATQSASGATIHLVPLFPAASDATLEGFARVVNHAGESGEVEVAAVDDTGVGYGPLTLSIDGNETVHFNSNDLEVGNAGKGLTGSTGAGEGGWRLALTSDLDIEVLSYVRTTDGFLTAMHDVAPAVEGEHRIAIFNPGSNTAQVSRLRLVNAGEEEAQVTIEGVDDQGTSPGSAVEVGIAAGAARTLTAAELESGGPGLTGALGDGAGKWRLTVRSDTSIHALSLLSSPTGHLTNLSTAPVNVVDGVHEVSLFPSASDASGRQGFVRVVNRSDAVAEVAIAARDETVWEYEAPTLTLDGGRVAHFNSNDLEVGNADKGLAGSTGAGEGDWRLRLTSDADIEVLSYIRTTDGFLTAMHDVAPATGTRHRVAIFNPGSNTEQVSRLRLVNGGEAAAAATIVGTDDQGASPGSDLKLSIPAGETRTYTAAQLEAGAEGLEGALGDGAGKWRLDVTSDRPLRVLSLLSSPTGHLTNLSTATERLGGAGTAEEVFRTLISGPVLQSKCVNCHVEGGVSGNTRLVFVTDADADHLTKNFSVFEDFLAEVEDGADLILNKIQGVGHGGGIQVAAGTDDYANMERFLGLLAGEEVGPVAITPATLFDGVTMESWRSTLRRAAIVFAGRVPTEAEYASIDGGTGADLRAAIRNLMQGPEFHEFLIRGANDRLLTDRDGTIIDEAATDDFVDFSNLYYEKATSGISSTEVYEWHSDVQYGIRRAPLELIAHVVENDLPYTEVLTADYIMANSLAAQAYGASTKFHNDSDLHEFRPSEIVSYYRDDESKVSEYSLEFGTNVTNPGNLVTDYPHAGILNTTVFLNRYPTTATNRNRARSRWTHYHFVGLDIEKSASRTTDPVALADTDNPTMRNPACTVCHVVMDPMAGAFQNYGDEGLYRDQWGGLDSLDGLYKQGEPRGAEQFEISAWSEEEKQVLSVTARLQAGSNPIGLENINLENGCCTNILVDSLSVRDGVGGLVAQYEMEQMADWDDTECGNRWGDLGVDVYCRVVVSADIPTDGDYNIDVVAWVGYQSEEVEGSPGGLRIWAPMPDDFYRDGDTWYRDMREPGFDGEVVPDADVSLRWLAEKIAADERFAEAAVRFWWPVIMGREVSEPPEDENEAGFKGRLLASNAQIAEVNRLARGFRRGFGGGSPYNLKDLLVEITLSNWFRADTLADDDTMRSVALAHAGATRLLTPEELSRKTVALTGFDWERRKPQRWHRPGHPANWTNKEAYGLLYGGIDSDGIARRGRNMTSVMAGVAQRHAAASSCPIVMRELFLLDEEDRRVLDGMDIAITPSWEFDARFEIEAASREERETVVATGELTAGDATARLAFVNNETGDEPDRNLRLDRLDVRRANGSKVFSFELEDASAASGCEWNQPQGDHLAFYCDGAVEVTVPIPDDGRYRFEVLAWGDQAGDELAQLDVVVETDTVRSAGARAIRAKLADLYDKLLGVAGNSSSPDVQAAFDLFVETRNKGTSGYDGNFRSLRCDYTDDQYYFDGILDDVWREEPDANGDPLGWDRDRLRDLENGTDMSDPNGAARAWVTVLTYLMTDYRYLHL